ncbi:MAG: endolytic transglycosylase MltG [Lachnospiraceae bacterium]|nr:endolytic transglycosylase MltG [Lachnospiraceae bacterium]MBD5496788.1 endolytic transglycosylase MltG [Lachnospiraceae bacterium]MBD5511233.1 endolytic transglycosylase MltG [Lachnospiraceae bacterium]
MNIKQMILAVLGMIFKVAVAVLVIVVVYKGAITAYDYGYRVFQEPPVAEKPGMDVSVEITMGKSALQIGEILEAKGLIRDAKLFYVQNLLSHYKDKLRAGTYTLNTSMTMEEMMEVMSAQEPDEAAGDTGNQ